MDLRNMMQREKISTSASVSTGSNLVLVLQKVGQCILGNVGQEV